MNQDDLRIHGHAIEARIYAEIPENNFVPDTGHLRVFKFPENSPSLRVETGVKQGNFLLDIQKESFNILKVTRFLFFMIR